MSGEPALPAEGRVDRWDAVLVLGGGAGDGGEVPPWVANRCDRALKRVGATGVILTLSAGTVHKPLSLDEEGHPVYEALAAARYLIGRGFPAERILMEATSWDTIGNAYFARVVHCEPAGLRRLLVVTSAFHMPRTEAIFRWIFAAEPAGGGYELTFESVPDVGIALGALEARRAKEAESLRKLLEVAAALPSLRAIHHWLFTEHEAYRAAGLSAERTPADPSLLMSY